MKNYTDLATLLSENSKARISTYAEQILLLAKPITRNAKTSMRKDGEVVAIFCYYHKQWELLSEVDYGKKASSNTGCNTMCKAGVNAWTRQNNTIKQIGSTILSLLENDKINVNEISTTKTRLEAEARIIDISTKPIGYNDSEIAEILA